MRSLVVVLSLLFGSNAVSLAASPSQDEESAGLMAMVAKDYPGSLEHYSKAISLETDKRRLAQLYNQRGVVHDQMGDFQAALTDINQSLALKPRYALAYGSRSRVYLHQGLADKALGDANKRVSLANAERTKEISPEANFHCASALAGRAEIYEAMGRREDAIADYRKALAYQPNDRLTKDALTRLGVNP